MRSVEACSKSSLVTGQDTRGSTDHYAILRSECPEDGLRKLVIAERVGGPNTRIGGNSARFVCGFVADNSECSETEACSPIRSKGRCIGSNEIVRNEHSDRHINEASAHCDSRR